MRVRRATGDRDRHELPAESGGPDHRLARIVPRGGIVGRIKTIFMTAYFAAWLAACILVPLVVMHGYRQWWLVTFYALMAVTALAGSINHYRIGRRNRKS
jgi:hypothetical protein